MSNPKSQKGRDTSSPSKKPTCEKCSKKHYGDFLVGTDNYFGYVKSGNRVKDCSKRCNTNEVGNLKLVVLICMLQRIISFMHFAQEVNKRVLPMW